MRKSIRKILLTVIMVLTVLAATLALSACSYFTDFVKDAFDGDKTTSASKEQGGQQGDKPSGEISFETDDDPRQGEEPGEGHGGEGGEVEARGIVTFTSDLTFDKASMQDFSIVATHEKMSFYQLMGAGMVQGNSYDDSRYYAAINQSGKSTVMVDGEYLSSLTVGSYDLYYVVSDGMSLFYEPFAIKVVNTSAKPGEIKLDYDVNCPDVYVVWKCDCGGSHTVTLDGATCTGVNQSKVKVNSVDKTKSHTVCVACESGGGTATVTTAKPSAAAAGYLSQTFAWNGRVYDRYLESDADVITAFEYMLYGGADISMQFGVSDALGDRLETGSSYFSTIVHQLDIPWTSEFSYSYDHKNVVQLNVRFSQSTTSVSSGYLSGTPLAENYAGNYVKKVDEAKVRKDGELPVDALKPAPARTVKELMQVVQLGLNPQCVGENACNVYQKARKFCLDYISADMTTVQKIKVIHDYLAGEIQYDYSVLGLYKLLQNVDTSGALNAETDKLLLALSTADFYVSPALSAGVQGVCTEAKTGGLSTVEFYSLLQGYISSLKAFGIEGVFEDGIAVCEGISSAFTLLCAIEGIECKQVTGYAIQGGSNISHAWNKVKVDGKWYCVDATWDNMVFGTEKYVTHKYFMVGDEEFYEMHRECIGNYVGVQELACGDYDYYASTLTSDGDLQIDTLAELESAVTFFMQSGYFIEFRCAPSLVDLHSGTPSPLVVAITNAMKKMGNKQNYSIQYAVSGRVEYVLLLPKLIG